MSYDTSRKTQSKLIEEFAGNTKEKTEGKKYDRGKPKVDLIPSAALLEVAKVMTFGAEKYGDHNWRSGMDWSRYTAAALRHILAYNDGEDNDKESGINHIAHAIAGLMMLLEYNVKGVGNDDRYKR